MPKLNTPDAITIDFAKVGKKFTVDTSKWTDTTLSGLLQFALQEKANNAASGKNGNEAEAAVAKVFDAITRGEVRMAGGGGKRLDPVFVEMRKITAARLKLSETAVKKTVKTPADLEKVLGDVAKKLNKPTKAVVDAIRKRAKQVVELQSADLD